MPGSAWQGLRDRKLSFYYKTLSKQNLGQNFHSQAEAWEREKIPAHSPSNPMKKIGKSRPGGSVFPIFFFGSRLFSYPMDAIVEQIIRC